LAKLSAKASKLAHVVNNDQAAALSENLFNASTLLEEQRALFTELRSETERFIGNEVTPKDLTHFKRLPLSLKASILVSIGFSVVNTSAVEVDRQTIYHAVRVAKAGCSKIACIEALGDMQDAAILKQRARCSRPSLQPSWTRSSRSTANSLSSR
jgi:hypothetical protein